MVTDEEKRTIATMVVEEMDKRRRERMAEAPKEEPPRKERRLCLFTVLDHGVGFPDGARRAVLEKCFYAWATFSVEKWTRTTAMEDVTVVALGDGRPLPTPLHTTLFAGLVSCIQIEDQSMFLDPNAMPAHPTAERRNEEQPQA